VTRIFLFTALSVFCLSANAEFPQDVHGAFNGKPKPFVSLTGYTTFIKGDWAAFSGIRAGLNFNNTFKFGVGVSHLSSSVVTSIPVSENTLSYTTNASMHFTYGEVSAEYIFYNEGPWQLSIPLVIGCGNAHYNYISRTNSVLTQSSNYTVWITEPEIAAQYTIFKWLGAGASVGYLGTLHAPAAVKGSFNSFTFSAGFNLFVEEVWNSVMKK
jgi:hypothetical protein